MRGGLEFPLGPIAVLYTANLTPDPDTGIGRIRTARSSGSCGTT